MADLIETVGARLVLMGQKEYIAGMTEAKKSLGDLATGAKTVAASSADMNAATVKVEAAQKELNAAMQAAVAAQREYNAALEASAAAELESVRLADEAAAAKKREADARLAAAEAARTAALTEVQAADESAAAAVASAGTVQAAEERKAVSAGISSSALRTAAFGVVAIAGTVAAVGVKMAADFQSSTTRLVTSAGESAANLDMVRQGILSLAGDVGYSADELSAAMYKIESGGQHGAAGLEVLKAAAQGAKTENADLTVVADAVTSVLQDYHLKASDAADITSKLVAATASGKMSFEELSGALSSVLPVASIAHVSINDILGDVASMTVHGMSAAQSTQNLADAIRKMQTAASSQGQTRELALLGIDARQLSEDLGTKGLSGTMQEVSKAIEDHMGPGSQTVVLNMMSALKGLPPAVQDLGQKVIDGTISLKDFSTQAKSMGVESAAQVKQFASLAGSTHQIGSEQQSGQKVMQNYTQALRAATGDATAMNVALLLTGENSATTAGAIDSVSNAYADGAGNVKGWDEIQGTFNQKLSQAKDSLGSLAISIGTQLLPPLTVLVGWIATATTWLSQHKDVAIALAAVIGGVLVGGLILATVALWGMIAPLLIIEGALTPLAITVLVVVAALALIGFAAYEIVTHWSTIKDFFVGLWNTVVSAARAAWAWVVNAVQVAAGAVVSFFAPVVGFFVTVWNMVRDVAVGVWNWIVGVVRTAVDGIISFFQPVVDAVRSHWDEIKQVTTFVWTIISGFFTTMWAFISSIFQVALNVITAILKFTWGLIVAITVPMWEGIKSFFEITWAYISGVFNVAVAVLKLILDAAWNVIRSTVKVVWDVIVMIFQGAWDLIMTIFKIARDIVVGIIVVLLDLVTGHWSRAWTDIKDFLGRIWNDITTGLTDYVTHLWANVKQIFTDMWNGTKQIFGDLWTDLKGVFTTGANAVIHIINGFLDVVNKVAGAIGLNINLHIGDVPAFEEGGTLPVRLLAQGGALFSEVGAGFMTNGPRAIVGEGDPNHPEYVIPTDPAYRGRAMGLLAGLMGDLGVGGGTPGGGGGMPMFADGGILGSIWGGIKGAAGSVASGFNAAVDWVGNAARDGITKVVEGVWPPLDVPQNSLAGMVPGELNSWRTKTLDWLKGKYDAQQTAASGGYGGPGGAAPPGQVHDWIVQALGILGYPATYAAGIYHQIMTESGGNPGVTQHGYTDVNTLSGNLAQGIMQVIPPTFRANMLPGHGNPFNPVDNIIAGSRYAMGKYGPGWFADGAWHGHGYKTGGVLPLVAREGGGPVQAGAPYLVGEAGPELFIPDSHGSIVSTDDTSRWFGGGGDGPAAGAMTIGARVTVEAGAVVIYEAHDPQATYEAVKQGIADAVARR